MLTDEDKKRIEEEEGYRTEVRENIEKEQKPKPKKFGKGCLTVIGILFGLFILLGLLGSSSDNKSENKPETTQENTKVEVESASSENIPEENDASAIAEYGSQMGIIMQNVSDAMTNLSTLAGEWPDWSNDDVVSFAASGLIIQNSYKNASELIPPKKFESVHNTALKGLKLWSDSITIINSGIDDSDADKISQAAKMLEEGTTYIQDATRQIDEITASSSEN